MRFNYKKMVCGKTLPKSFINAMYKFRAFYNNFRIVDYLLTVLILVYTMTTLK